MADGKWISGLQATTPLVEAARRVLKIRLGVVRDYLPLVLHEADKDPEHVHQLRVGTRRAAAALRIFADCLPNKAFQRVRKTLRRLRRAAGQARDWDVFVMELGARLTKAPARQKPGLDFLLGYAFAQREAAQTHLRQTAPDKPIDQLIAETLSAIRAPDKTHSQLRDLACPLVGELIQDLEKAAARNLERYDRLHQVRILGKRLRYAMEVVESCFDPPFREEYYPAVEQMQEILGRANDSHVAGQRLTALSKQLKASRPAEWKRWQAGIEELRQFHRQRLPEQRRLFEQWWGDWEKSGAGEALRALVKN